MRVGEVEDIANAALFLGSGAAAYITGTNIVVDGGSYLTFPNMMFMSPEFKSMWSKAKL
jgi:peroxisomal 2,4-dienoyl-CoA reductase